MSSTPHDALFTAVFGKPEHAAGALRSVLPAAVAETLDWSTLAPCSGNFVDDLLRKRYGDVLFSIAWRGGGDALLYLLFEHQSTSDRWMAFRLLRYLVRIWERWLDENPEAEALPVVIPVVLYHDTKTWTAPVTFEELFEIPDAVRSALGPHLVRFSYLIDDLSLVPDDHLRGRAMTALARLVTVCFKHARTHTDIFKLLADWADVVRDVLRAPNGTEALAIVVRYIYLVNEYVDRETLQVFLADMVPDAKDAIMTAGERLIEQGVQQGVQQGKCELLLHQLRRRFGDQITAETELRVVKASAEQLLLWSDRILTAATLRELFAD